MYHQKALQGPVGAVNNEVKAKGFQENGLSLQHHSFILLGHAAELFSSDIALLYLLCRSHSLRGNGFAMHLLYGQNGWRIENNLPWLAQAN